MDDDKMDWQAWKEANWRGRRTKHRREKLFPAQESESSRFVKQYAKSPGKKRRTIRNAFLQR